jgi:PAS domain S-box-containing protein
VILSYGLAVASVTAALIILWWMESALQAAAYVSLFLLAVMLATWLGGIGPGLLATALSALAFAYYFLSPVYSLAVEIAHLPRLLLFALLALLALSLIAVQRSAAESLRRARDELQETNKAVQMENIERKRTEEALRQSEFDLAEAQRVARLGSWSFDIASSAVKWSEELYRIFDIEKTAFGGTYETFLSRVHPDDRTRVVQMNAETRSTGEPFELDYRITTRSGQLKHIREVGYVRKDSEGAISGLFGTAQDITERKQAELNLQALSRRLLEVQENERRHIARELHDEIGQVLTGIKLALERSARGTPDRVKSEVAQALGLTNELIARVRDLSLELRPAMLDDLGLLSALTWYFERYASQFKIEANFQHAGLEGRRFEPDIETAAYRIVQEALTNVARHAGVDKVEVDIRADESALAIRVEDLGAGFDPHCSSLITGGLSGMRERAILLGGRLQVKSSPGHGTSLTAELPLKRTVASESAPAIRY